MEMDRLPVQQRRWQTMAFGDTKRYSVNRIAVSERAAAIC